MRSCASSSRCTRISVSDMSWILYERSGAVVAHGADLSRTPRADAQAAGRSMRRPRGEGARGLRGPVAEGVRQTGQAGMLASTGLAVVGPASALFATAGQV